MDRGSGRRLPDPEVAPPLLAGFGMLLFLWLVVETVAFGGLDPAVVFAPEYAIPSSIYLVLVAGVVSGAVWLRRSSLEPDRYWRVVGWCGAGALVLVTFDLVLLLALQASRLWLIVGGLRLFTALGAGIGLLVGVVEGRAIQEAIESERSQLHADYLESRRAWLTFLNGLLRHEVLNSAQVIEGYAGAVLENQNVDEETREALETIRNQSEDMTSVIDDIRILIEATRGEDRIRTVDLTDALRSEIRAIEETYSGVAVDADIPSAVPVEADELLPRVFGNLLHAAVERGDRDGATLGIRVDVGSETVTIALTDDGPPLRLDNVGSLSDFSDEGSGTLPTGLQIADHLVQRYDGTLDVTAGDGGDSTVTVTLDRPADATDDPERLTPHRDEARSPNAVRQASPSADGGWTVDAVTSSDET